jgi:protein-L-isoaspartate(D-aspartate) O-methyltransferase
MTTPVEHARFNMIEQQVRPWNVLDERVLRVLSELPREAFVPDAYQALAYADLDIPIGERTCMLAPKVVGRMLQALQVQPKDRVLEVGTGTGYATACLARLGGRVVSVEIDPDLAAGARQRIDALNLHRVEVRSGDAMAGPLEDAGPFDVIAVTGSVPTEEPIPMLARQLAPGGRLFIIVGEDPVMEARLETRVGASADLRRESLFETSVPALKNVPQPERFVF